MKKLEKLRNKEAQGYLINPDKPGYLEKLQKNKYLIFCYEENEKRTWKFIKTQKILKIEREGIKYRIFTNVDNHEYLADGNFFITGEFTLAKVLCDEENGTRKNY